MEARGEIRHVDTVIAVWVEMLDDLTAAVVTVEEEDRPLPEGCKIIKEWRF